MIRIDSYVLPFERFFSRSYSFESGTDSSPLVRFSLHRRAIFGLALLRSLLKRSPFIMEPQQLEDLLFYATIGVIVGGRLGYVLFYNPVYFLQPAGNPNGLAWRHVLSWWPFGGFCCWVNYFL